MRARRHYYHEQSRAPLARDMRHARLGGVCAGVARYLDISRFFVRLGTLIALFIAPQFVLVAYGIGYLVMDER